MKRVTGKRAKAIEEQRADDLCNPPIREQMMKAMLTALLLVCVACTPTRSEQRIHVSEFRNYGATPLQHTFYLGSDSEHHHFTWSNGKQGGRWLIRKSEMPIINERVLTPESGRSGYIALLDSDGTWRVR